MSISSVSYLLGTKCTQKKQVHHKENSWESLVITTAKIKGKDPAGGQNCSEIWKEKNYLNHGS